MLEKHPLPTEAQQHLDQISHDPTRQRVAEHIQGLHLVGNLQLQQQPEAEFVPDFTPENDIVSARMRSLAEQGAMAHIQLAEEGQTTDGEISAAQIWEKVIENQLASAIKAKEEGDSEKSIDTLVDYLITTELTQALPDLSGTMKTSDNKVESVLNAPIAEGLSSELVEASRRSYGLVHIEPGRGNSWLAGSSDSEREVEVTSIAHTIEKVKPQTEIVIGREISVDPEDSPQGAELMPEAIDERVGQLSLKSSVATAQGVAKAGQHEGTQRPELIDSLTVRALEELPKNSFTYVDKAEELMKLHEANPSLSNPTRYEEQFRAIRDLRSTHTHYRINIDGTMPLDRALVDLWERGDKNLAGRILTAGNEIAVREDGYPEGAIGHMVADKPEVAQEIQEEVERRQQACRHRLEALLPSDKDGPEVQLFEQNRDFNLIIDRAMATQDPERTVDILLDWAETSSVSQIASTIEILDGSTTNGSGRDLLIMLTSQNNEFFQDKGNGSEFKQVVEHPVMEVLRKGGILHNKADIILREIFTHEDKVALCDSFTRPQPLWKSLVQFTELMVGSQVDSLGDQQKHLVKIIPQAKTDFDSAGGERLSNIDGYRPIVFSELTTAQKRQMAQDELRELSDEEVKVLEGLSFDKFNSGLKKDIFAFQLQQTVELSRDTSEKRKAELRNERAATQGEPVVEEGDFVHGTDLSALTSILQDGNVAGEARKADSRADSFPYNVDFSVINEAETVRQRINSTISYQSYSGGEEGVMLVYKRSPDSWMAGQETEAREGHELIFGGIPSTEISGLILKVPSSSLEKASRAVVENGFYIPIYDEEGNNLFSPEDYTAMQQDLNMQVEIPPENIIDSSLKAEDQKGVSEGGLYLFPTEEGPVKYYVKFAENPDHVWTEYAADELYRAAGVAVPDSRVVMVEGRLGRASRWVENGSELPESESSTLEDGAAMDMLLANWDVVYNAANIMKVDGKVLRPDSGSALDMWATGVYKKDGTWGGEVHELEQGTDRQKLWEGMRQEYSELTDEKLKRQVQTIKEQLTDEVIDGVIDSIRRPREARDSLKEILKARRNYMIQKVLGTPSADVHTEPEPVTYF